MFTNGQKSEVEQPYQCLYCHGIFNRTADDDAEICENCLSESED
jgi:hypothetical protein